MSGMVGYEVRESKRARSVRVSVHVGGLVVVTKPVRVSLGQVDAFVRSRRAWIEGAVEKMKRRAERNAKNPKIFLPRLRRGTSVYKQTIKEAKILANSRLKYFSAQYQIPYGTVTIRNQKTRWGSCTRAGNLSFNFRIIYLPPELADYVIVHELCHVREHNHSDRFWALVAKEFPNYRELRKKLRTGFHF